MTISSPTFQRLQDGIQRVDDLRVRGPINAALKWLSGELLTQLNTHFGDVSQSISVAIQLLKGTANTWTAAQTVTLAGTGSALTLRSSDSTATAGPDLTLDRQSNSPAAADTIARVVWNGRDSGGTARTYGLIDVLLEDVSAGSEDATMRLFSRVNGATGVVAQFGNGVQIGSPTGGAQGAGTLNMDNAIFRDGTQVVSSRVTGYGDPFGAVSRATISVTTVTTAALAQFVAAIYTDLKAHGLVGN